MAIFQDITKVLSDTSNTVKKKAQEASELARLRGQLSDVNQEIERLYGQVGKAYYTARGSRESFETADAFCERIDALRVEMKDLQQAIDKKRSRSRCKNCGAVLSPQAKYCIECGEKVEPEEEEAQPEQTPPEQAEE